MASVGIGDHGDGRALRLSENQLPLVVAIVFVCPRNELATLSNAQQYHRVRFSLEQHTQSEVDAARKSL